MTSAAVAEVVGSAIDDATWEKMSEIINLAAENVGDYGPGHLKMRRFRSHAERNLREAGYTPEQVRAAWSRHWHKMTLVVEEAHRLADETRAKAIDEIATANPLELPEEQRLHAAQKLLEQVRNVTTTHGEIDRHVLAFYQVGMLIRLGVSEETARKVIYSRY